MQVRIQSKAGFAVIASLAVIAPVTAAAQQAPGNVEPVIEPLPTAAIATPEKPAVKKPAPASKSLADWRGKVLAHLNSNKRGVRNGAGTATVAFKIDRSGKVTSAQVVTSSGNKALDAEAVALTQRASPVPPPPADVAGSSLYLKVPIRFAK